MSTTGDIQRLIRRRNRRARRCAPLCLACLVVVLAAAGCSSSDWARMRRVPRNPLAQPLRLLSRGGPQPTPRTMQLLRRYDLADGINSRVDGLVTEFQRDSALEPTADHVYSTAELAYIAAKKAEARGDEALELDMYATALASAYDYLLNDSFDQNRNPYDPQFRRACDLYNAALESALRIAQRRGTLKPGGQYTIETTDQTFDFRVEARGRWRADHFEQFKFVSDFEVQGLSNHYHTYGLGVPLIAVWDRKGNHDSADPYYPPGMSVPVTAFVRVDESGRSRSEEHTPRRHCVIELYDTLSISDVTVNGRLVPLESDLTTPLAYSLDNPDFKNANLATRGLLNPRETGAHQGLYMLEPYDPQKIPVLMVHGFWSSVVTWMEMFNDLRGSPEIRDNYQFWFYLYPTGQPFWITAAQLRDELLRARITLDADYRAAALDRMVLVGHSMGGLICKLQTLYSQNDYWQLVSDQPFERLNATGEDRDRLASILFFRPNPSVQRVVMIATPHRGSTYSNAATQWLGRRLISLPRMLVDYGEWLARDDRHLLRDSALLNINTSIDSLAPDSPILPVMLRSPRAPGVKYHNIVGVVDSSGVIGKVAGESDGVVTVESAHLPDADSEVVVKSDHFNVHRAPRTVLEVYRILREHHAQYDRVAAAPAESGALTPQTASQ